jgi:hypothetical protein
VAERLECEHEGVQAYRLASQLQDVPDSVLYIMDRAARDRLQPVLLRLKGAGKKSM